MAHDDWQRHGSPVLTPPAAPAPDQAVTRRSTWPGVALVAVAVALVRLLASLIARQTGFLEYNADGYARIIHAAEWARAPRFDVGVWLPLQFWLTGMALWAWPDLAVTPIVLNSAAALGSAWLLAAIGWRLGGPAVGLTAGLLAAGFPWSVWFGLSGLAEAPFALAVSAAGLGLVTWLQATPVGGVRSSRGLWLAALALLAATMLRYEGWFYALALAPLVVAVATPGERRRPRTLAPLVVPFLFPAVWVGASALISGDPFSFAHVTSDITAAEATHESLTAIERLIFYPIFAATLAWPVVGLALAGALWQRRRPGVVGYTLWLLGELAVLALVTARFSGIGAGRDRYVMSTIVLLLPLVSLTVVALWQRAGWTRLAALAAAGLLIWFSGATLLGRSHPYPAPATVSLAARLRTAWAAGELDEAPALPMEVGVPGEDNATFNESYALRVLTNRLDGVTPVWDLTLFNRIVADRAPGGWITDRRLVNSDRPVAPAREEFGPYTLHFRPPPPAVSVVGPARAGTTISLHIDGLQPREVAGLWLTAADGRTVDLGQTRASATGSVRHALALPATLPPGRYTLSVRGATTGATGTTRLTTE